MGMRSQSLGTQGTTSGEKLVQIGSNLRTKAADALAQEERQSRFRPTVYWYLTFRCNLSCAHCSVQSSPWVDTSRDLTTEECMAVIDQFVELNVSAASVSGGEFLIRPDALQIMERLADNGIRVGLETNGLRFDDRFFRLAKNLQERRLLGMTISLDGGTRETHEKLRGPRSFDRTVRGLRLLKDNDIRFNVQCVLNGVNYHTIRDLYQLAAELSPALEAVQWAILNPVGRGSELVRSIGIQAEHIEPIFRDIKIFRSMFDGYTMIKVPPAMIPPKYLPMVVNDQKVTNPTSCQFPLLGVLPDGEVTICAVSRDNQELSFGNIRDPNVKLKAIWQEQRMAMLRGEYLLTDHLEGICGDCVWKYSCKGACRAWAYEEGGSFGSAFPVCEALEEAGRFPKQYRISHQQAAVTKYQEMQMGCACSS